MLSLTCSSHGCASFFVLVFVKLASGGTLQADGGGITRNASGEKVSPFWEAGRDKLAKAQKRHTSDAVQNNEDGTEGALTNRVR